MQSEMLKDQIKPNQIRKRHVAYDH